MTGISASAGGRATDARRVYIDAWLVVASVLLLVVGFMSLYSEGGGRHDLSSFKKQAINAVIGIIPFSIFAWVNPRFWQRIAVPIYIGNLAMLAAVLLFGKSAKGAARWIDIGPLQFQPSELAKLLIILTLASFYASRTDRIAHPMTFFLGLAHAILPALLIYKQPHLGAFGVILATWFAISLVAQVPLRYLLTFAAAVVGFSAIVWAVPPIRNRVLDRYQIERILGLFNLDGEDVQGRDWQTYRAAIAFAEGGVTGTGFGNGRQKAGQFIPEQRNDFIFTVVGEEGGLIGSTLVLLLFGFLFYRIFLIMHLATEPFFRMVAGGIFAVLGFHTFVNIAMVLQLLPVVGLWLPFLSHGGTALWLCMACIGLLLNIRRRENPVLF
jgi:rod shape determining protein RodA